MPACCSPGWKRLWPRCRTVAKGNTSIPTRCRRWTAKDNSVWAPPCKVERALEAVPGRTLAALGEHSLAQTGWEYRTASTGLHCRDSPHRIVDRTFFPPARLVMLLAITLPQ